MNPLKRDLARTLLNRSLIVCLLGYFIDQYDLGLFAINRIASLKSLGLDDANTLRVGIDLFNLQMIGMLAGGILGGIWGDKRGRASVLYGSMLVYAVGNITNAFVHTIYPYAICRFVSGFGLAAEIGASLTIIAEVLPAEMRSIGLMLLIAIGHAGGVLAALLAPRLDWRANYFIGGILGFALLGLRIRARNSVLYERVKSSGAPLGSVRLIFKTKYNAFAFLKGVLIGLPVYAVSGILLGFAPEIGRALGIPDPILPAITFPCYYVAVIVGDFTSGLLSLKLRSSKQAIGYMQLVMLFAGVIYFGQSRSPTVFYAAISLLGFASGHWVLVNLVATEQFGTNIRATVATATPNFVRASAVLMTLGFSFLKSLVSVDHAALIVASICLALSLPSVLKTRETFGDDLDFTTH